MMEGNNKQPSTPSSNDSKCNGTDDSDFDAMVNQIELGNFDTALQTLSKESVVSLTLGPQQDSLLHFASKQGNMGVVEQLVQEYSCSPLACNQNGQTCLHAATSCGHLQVLRYLLKACKAEGRVKVNFTEEKKEGEWKEEETGRVGEVACNSDAQQVGMKDNYPADSTAAAQSSIVCSNTDNSGNSLLHVCAMHGQLTIAKFLVSETKRTVLTANVDGHTPMHLAAKHGHLEMLKYLASVANCSTLRDKESRSALHLAVEEGHVDVARFLVKHKLCDPTETITRCEHYAANSSLLHIAAQKGHLEIMMYLVDEVGCSLYQKDGSDNLPLHIAVIYGNLEVVKYLIYQKWHSPLHRGEGGKTVLYLASQHGHLEVLQYFIKQVKIILSHEDLTALLSAAQVQSLVHLKNLLEKHMNGEIISKRRCDRRFSDLHFAAKEGQLEVVKYLIREQSCDPLFKGDSNMSALHLACMNGHGRVVKFMMKYVGENLLCFDEQNNTPLHLASLQGSLRNVKYLVEKDDRQLMARNNHSHTPLHVAAAVGHLDVVKYLVEEKNCASFLVEENAVTPTHLACLYGRANVVKYLIDEKGVSSVNTDPNGSTLLHMAAQSGHLNLVKWLYKKHPSSALVINKSDSTPVITAACFHKWEVVRYFLSETDLQFRHSEFGLQNLCWHAVIGNRFDLVQYCSTCSYVDSSGNTKHDILQVESTDPCQLLIVTGNHVATILNIYLPFHLACASGHFHLAKYFIEEQNISPYSKSSEGVTSLHLAAWSGHLELVKYLVEEKGCDVLVTDKNLRQPFHYAIIMNQLNVVMYFMSEKGCDPLSITEFEDGANSLHLSCLFGHLNMAKYFIKDQNIDHTCKNNKGLTPLHFAVFGNHLTIVKYLVEELHCNPLATNDKLKLSAFHYASLCGHVELIRYFVSERECDPMSRSVLGRMSLHIASLNGHIKAVQYFVENWNVDILCRDDCKCNSLQLAAYNGHIDVLKYLAEKDPRALRQTWDGYTVLHLAAAKGQVNVVKFLIEQIKCDPECEGESNENPIQLACANGHLQVVKYLYEECKVSLFCVGRLSFSLLHIAAYFGFLPVVNYLVNKGCDIFQQNSDQNMPLHCAAMNGHLEIVKALLAHMKDHMYRGLWGMTILHCACFWGHLHIVKHICQELKPDISCKDMFQHTSLHSASYSGHLQIVQYLIDNGCDIMSRDHTFCTAFHLAIIQGHSETVQYFISRNFCDPMLRGTLDRTPLHLASLNGHLPLVQLFVEDYKVNHHCYDRQKQTPLHLAAAGGQLEVFMYLIEKGCDPSCTDSQNQTPLHLAAYGGHLDVVKYATEVYHCDVERKDNNSNTALHLAAIGGKLCINRYFIMNTTFDPQCKGYCGRTPLHFACERGHLNVVKYYVDELHVSPSCVDNNGNTPLHLAAITQQMHIVKYLIEEKGCNIMVTNKHHRTPLHEALLQQRWTSVQYLTDEKRFNLKEAQNIMQALISMAIKNEDLNLVDRCCSLCPTSFSVNSSESTPMQSIRVEFAWRSSTINTTSNYQTNKSPVQIRNFRNITFQLPVHMACAFGNLPILKCLIRHGMDPDEFHNDHTPLHLAALNGHLSIVKYLVETAKCKLDNTGKFLYTPLHLAVAGKKLEVVKYFVLKRGCDPMQTVDNGSTCLHLACTTGDINTVKFLVTECNVSLECTTKHGETPLHFAALLGHLHVVKYLVEGHKCDLTRRSNDGALALHSASLGGSLDVFRYLLNHRGTSDPLTGDNLGRSFVHNAAYTGQLTIIRYAIDYLKIELTEDHEGCTPLHFAAIGGNLQVVKALVWHQNDSHHCDHAGRLPLHLASQHGHVELVKYFIETKKCDPSCCDEDRRTPLHLASLNGHVQTTDYLITKCKVNPDCRDVRKCTPLHFAAHNGKLHVVKYLLDTGCDIASRDETLSMPIHYAAHAGHLHIVKFLVVEKNCDPNPEGDFQVTPLHNAIVGGHLNMVRFLIEQCKVYAGLDKHLLLHFSVWFGHLNLVKYYIREHKCSPMFSTADDKTPLHFASMRGHLDIVQYLILEYNADIFLEDEDGNTPVHLACINGHQNVVIFLIDQSNEVDLDLCDELVCLASKHGHLEIIQFLLEELGLMVSSKQSLDIAHENGHVEIVRYLFSKGYGSEVVQPSHYTRPPILPRTQLYVIGNPESGKTTLIKSLQNPSSLNGWLSGLLWSVDEPYSHKETAGIVPTELQTSQLNNITIFDFAGQTEYYTYHGDFLEGVSHAVVLLTIDISCSEKALKRAFNYWHMFIDSAIKRSCVVRVVVVGTHRDKLAAEQWKRMVSSIQECMQESRSQFIDYIGCITLDSRNSASQEFSKLIDMIESCCKMVCYSLQLDYNNGSILNVFLKNRFPNATVCSFCVLQKSLEESKAPDLSPLKRCETLFRACETLHKSGYIKLVKLPGTGEIWLILNMKLFLAKLHVLMKHPKFPATKGLGLLSATRLTHFLSEKLQDSDITSQLAMHYMVTMQYCAKVDEPEMMKVDSKITSTANKEFYFFPQLVQLERPKDIWITNSEYLYKCGWKLKCADDNSFFNPDFLCNLLIFMVLKFGLDPKLHPHNTIETNIGCKLWKNGVRWLDRAGLEMVIDLSGEQNSVISLLMRCLKGAELQLVALRSFLVQQILQFKEKHPSLGTCEEVLIHPHCLTQYPSEQSSEIKMSELSMVIVQKRPNVLLDSQHISYAPGYPLLAVSDLVYYDGYVGLGPVLLQDLLMDDNRDKVLDYHILKEIAKAAPTTSLVLETVLGMRTPTASDSLALSSSLLDTLRRWSAETDGKYRTLRNALDQYSLFAGRSLLSQCLDICEQTDVLLITAQRTVSPTPARNKGKPRMNEFQLLKGRDCTVQIIKNIAYKWESVAYRFHFETYEVNTITRDSFNEAETACEKMLSRWLLGEHRTPVTWSTVVKCLRECEFRTLADDLDRILSPEEQVSSNSEPDVGEHRVQTHLKGVDLHSPQPHLHELRVLKKEHSTINIIQTVAPKWKELATALQLRPDDIEEIAEETSEEDQACEAVFRQWLSGRHRVPVSWSTVVMCLSECGLQDLAQDVARVLDLQ